MVSINQESLLSSIIPDIFVSKITLETSGTPLIESNPHIDHPWEQKSLLQRDDSNNLLVKIDLLINEKFSNNLIGNWFEHIDIQKYIIVKVFQSTNSKVTTALSLSQDMLELVDDNNNINISNTKTKLFGTITDSKSINEILNILSGVKTEIISNLKDKKIRKIESVDSNGNKLTSFTVTVKFNISNAFPEHLAYFIFSSFDIKALAKDFSLDYNTLSLEQTNGKVVSEVVIDEGNLVSYSFMFTDEQQQVWTGPIHLLPSGQWRSEDDESATSVNLTRNIVVNNKIQDFRNVKDIQKLQFDFSGIKNELTSVKVHGGLNLQTDIRRIAEYFSDFTLTRDKNGDAKFFFSINFEKLILENTLYGGLVKKSGSRFIQEMIQQTKIRHLKILRRRVKNQKTSEKFDPQESDELIVVSSEKEFGNFAAINNSKAALKELQIVLDNNIIGVRHFTGMDKTMSDVTDGIYQYGIEMEIDDSSVLFFVNKLLNLKDAKIELEKYYNEASKISISKFLAEVQDPHIKHVSEHDAIVDKVSGNFDITNNRFTKSFTDTMIKTYSGAKLKSAPWIAPIVIYADILDTFTDAFLNPKDKKQVLNSLFNFTSPKTGNPSGINCVIKLMNNFISILESIIGTTVEPSSKKIGTTKSGSKISKRTFKLEKFFVSTFNSNLVKGIGIDYLSNGRDDTINFDGIKRISSKKFAQRINNETLRFYNTLQPDINISFNSNQITSKDKISNTSFSFLTPSRVDTPQRSISLMNLDDQEASEQEREVSEKQDRNEAIKNTKRERIEDNADSGDAPKKEKMAEIQSAIILQNMIPDQNISSVHTVRGDVPDRTQTRENTIVEINLNPVIKPIDITLKPPRKVKDDSVTNTNTNTEPVIVVDRDIIEPRDKPRQPVAEPVDKPPDEIGTVLEELPMNLPIRELPRNNTVTLAMALTRQISFNGRGTTGTNTSTGNGGTNQTTPFPSPTAGGFLND